MHTNTKARVQAKLSLPLHPIAWNRLSLNYFIQALSTHLPPGPNSGVIDTCRQVPYVGTGCDLILQDLMFAGQALTPTKPSL